MNNNYYFIDESALLAQIRDLQKKQSKYKDRKLKILNFLSYFFDTLRELNAGTFKRVVFYFPQGEKQIDDYISVPKNYKKQRDGRDINFKYCGEKLKGTESYKKWLEEVPDKFIQYCVKSEKGVDIEICCDALQLAATGRLDRLFFLTNDRDFLPLLRTLKTLGANVSLLHLSDINNINKKLWEESDSFDTIPDTRLDGMFE